MTDLLLRDGTTTEDPRLDALVDFDPASKNYPVTATTGASKPRSYTWRLNDPAAPLDQGREGACVGFCAAHELMARPAEVEGLNTAFAMKVYREAQKRDQWEGEAYSGTSVIAGMQTLQALGYIKNYYWAFSMEEFLIGLGTKGPAVLGIPWYDGMYEPHGRDLRVSGRMVGRHAILAVRSNLRTDKVTLFNSWGPLWGDKGEADISFDALAGLLANQGEACFAVGRKTRISG